MQTKILKILVFASTLGLISLITNASQREKIISADSLFVSGNYIAALNLYEDAINSSEFPLNPSVYLKCAFIAERFGEVPKTIYYLSRYNQSIPSITVSEKITKLANEAGFEGYEKNDLNSILTFIAANYYYIIFIFMLLAAGLYYILFAKFFRNQSFLKRHSLLLSFYLFGMLFIINTPFQQKNVIVNVPSAELRKEPSGASSPIRRVNAGDRLIYLGNVDLWSRVKFDGEIFFINSNNCWVLD